MPRPALLSAEGGNPALQPREAALVPLWPRQTGEQEGKLRADDGPRPNWQGCSYSQDV